MGVVIEVCIKYPGGRTSINDTGVYQWRLLKFDPSGPKFPGSGTEVIPGKHSDTRIKPLPLTNGHGCYITATPERTLVSVGEWPLHITVINLQPFHFRDGYITAVSILKPPFNSETAVWRFRKFNRHLDPEVV
jgi:hypothetical protein